MAVTELNGENFYEQLMLCEKTALITFYAQWCAPCKRMAPIVEELSEQLADVAFFKIDINESRDLINEYGIKAVPAVLLFKDGQEIGRKTGSATADDLKKLIPDKKDDESDNTAEE